MSVVTDMNDADRTVDAIIEFNMWKIIIKLNQHFVKQFQQKPNIITFTKSICCYTAYCAMKCTLVDINRQDHALYEHWLTLKTSSSCKRWIIFCVLLSLSYAAMQLWKFHVLLDFPQPPNPAGPRTRRPRWGSQNHGVKIAQVKYSWSELTTGSGTRARNCVINASARVNKLETTNLQRFNGRRSEG